MRGLENFDIDIFGLPNSNHSFEFEFESSFFTHFEHSIIERGSGKCLIELEKSDSMITTTYIIEGFIELICDRSNEVFDYFFKTKEKVVYKFGIEEKELSDNVFVIPKYTQRLNIAELLYQFITLEVPMKKLHPKYKDDDQGNNLIYQTVLAKEEESTDPRWEALKKLK